MFCTICYLAGDLQWRSPLCMGVRIASAGIFARLRLDGAHCTERRGAASARRPLGEILLSVAIWSGGPSLASLPSLAFSPLSIWDHWRMLLWPGPGPEQPGILQEGETNMDNLKYQSFNSLFLSFKLRINFNSPKSNFQQVMTNWS